MTDRPDPHSVRRVLIPAIKPDTTLVWGLPQDLQDSAPHFDRSVPQKLPAWPQTVTPTGNFVTTDTYYNPLYISPTTVTHFDLDFFVFLI